MKAHGQDLNITLLDGGMVREILDEVLDDRLADFNRQLDEAVEALGEAAFTDAVRGGGALSLDDTLAEALRKGMAGDPVSAFGSIIGLNRVMDADAAEVLTLAAQTLRRLRMEVVREDAPSRENGNVGYVEAVDRTLVIGFRDDVVVRVAGSGRGALVDVRSASRFGRHDLGRNAQRLREVLRALIERLQSTVPEQRRARGS